MNYSVEETIVAVASAPGGANRGIVRVGGEQVVSSLRRSFVENRGKDWLATQVAQAFTGQFQTPAFSQPIPCRLYLWPTSQSFTRQPLAEVHTVGSPPLLAGIVDAICQSGARLAQPGEFTMRAFLAGRIDLTQAEAVLGVIDADGRRQLDTALQQLAGGLSTSLGELRSDLLDLLAHLEAGLDFVEEDIEFVSSDELMRGLSAAQEQVGSLLQRVQSRTVSTERPRIALIGLPNAGKSSLFNKLAGGAAAIVSDQEGTTRDYVLANVSIAGIDCELVDTAGAEGVDDGRSISAHAQGLRAKQASEAALRVLCIDVSRLHQGQTRRQLADLGGDADLLVYTKGDLLSGFQANPATLVGVSPSLVTSVVTGEGLPQLELEIAKRIDEQSDDSGDTIASTAARCRHSLTAALEFLDRAQRSVQENVGEELVAAEIRGSLAELGKVVGAVYTDDILDRVFSRFCIGK